MPTDLDRIRNTGVSTKLQLVQEGNRYSLDAIYRKVPNTLEEIENEIFELQNNVWECGWFIGERLITIRDKYLNELKENYNSISEYAKIKFGLDSSQTSRFIFIAEYFTQADARQLGSKLRLLKKIKEEEHQEYLEWIKLENPTYRQIEEDIKNKYPTFNKPQKGINMGRKKMVVNFEILKKKIPKEKHNEFLERINLLIEEYSE